MDERGTRPCPRVAPRTVRLAIAGRPEEPSAEGDGRRGAQARVRIRRAVPVPQARRAVARRALPELTGPRQSMPRRPHAGARSREQEVELIKQLVNAHGRRKWAVVAAQLPGRSGKQRRERFKNQLDPNIKREPWSADEDVAICKAHKFLGTRWTEIGRLSTCGPNLSTFPISNLINDHAPVSVVGVNSTCLIAVTVGLGGRVCKNT